MFKSLKLKNVLCHKDAKLEFSPGVNMIIGPSDHGKSAIFNAFYKVISNRPSGDEWRAWDTNESEIELETEDHLIKYQKDSQAAYILQYLQTGRSHVFKAFGQKVPEEIQRAINMNQKINIQQQLERSVPIFLIAESPGDVAKHFNSVAGFDKIDSSISIGKSAIKSTEYKISEVNSGIQKKVNELKGYENLELFESLVEQAEDLENTILISENLVDKISRLSIGLGIKINQLETINKYLLLDYEIKKAKILFTQIEKLSSTANQIERIISNITKAKVKLRIAVRKSDLLPDVKQNLSLLTETQQLINNKNQIERLILSISDSFKSIGVLRDRYKQKNQKFKELMPKDFCPLCKKSLQE